MADEAVLQQHQPAHRPVPGDFNVTAVTFAAMALFDRLDSGQRERVVVPMDDENRRHWNFLPESGRRGVPVRDLDREQRYLAHRLIAQCTSVEGYAQVVQVMSLEHVLRELNAPAFGHVAAHFRDPEGYFLTFFGQPQPDTDWGWRLGSGGGKPPRSRRSGELCTVAAIPQGQMSSCTSTSDSRSFFGAGVNVNGRQDKDITLR